MQKWQVKELLKSIRSAIMAANDLKSKKRVKWLIRKKWAIKKKYNLL